MDGRLIARGETLAHSAPRSFLHTLKLCTKHKLLYKGDSGHNNNKHVSEKNKIKLIQFTHFKAIIWRMLFFQFLLRTLPYKVTFLGLKDFRNIAWEYWASKEQIQTFTPSCYMLWYYITSHLWCRKTPGILLC